MFYVFGLWLCLNLCSPLCQHPASFSVSKQLPARKPPVVSGQTVTQRCECNTRAQASCGAGTRGPGCVYDWRSVPPGGPQTGLNTHTVAGRAAAPGPAGARAGVSQAGAHSRGCTGPTSEAFPEHSFLGHRPGHSLLIWRAKTQGSVGT